MHADPDVPRFYAAERLLAKATRTRRTCRHHQPVPGCGTASRAKHWRLT